jgi:hypothetical protein
MDIDAIADRIYAAVEKNEHDKRQRLEEETESLREVFIPLEAELNKKVADWLQRCEEHGIIWSYQFALYVVNKKLARSEFRGREIDAFINRAREQLQGKRYGIELSDVRWRAYGKTMRISMAVSLKPSSPPTEKVVPVPDYHQPATYDFFGSGTCTLERNVIRVTEGKIRVVRRWREWTFNDRVFEAGAEVWMDINAALHLHDDVIIKMKTAEMSDIRCEGNSKFLDETQ